MGVGVDDAPCGDIARGAVGSVSIQDHNAIEAVLHQARNELDQDLLIGLGAERHRPGIAHPGRRVAIRQCRCGEGADPLRQLLGDGSDLVRVDVERQMLPVGLRCTGGHDDELVLFCRLAGFFPGQMCEMDCHRRLRSARLCSSARV